MATTKVKKAKVLEEVREALTKNQNIVLTEYRGLNVEQVTELRVFLRKAGVKLKVLKNTISKKLFQEAGMTNLEQYLHGPVAVGFLSKDIAASCKAILDFSKKNELLLVKGAYVDGKAVDLNGIKTIASLPPREVLLAMVLSTMQGPTKNLLSVLQGNTRKLVYALNAIKEQKQKQAA